MKPNWFTAVVVVALVAAVVVLEWRGLSVPSWLATAVAAILAGLMPQLLGKPAAAPVGAPKDGAS